MVLLKVIVTFVFIFEKFVSFAEFAETSLEFTGNFGQYGNEALRRARVT
jgi:hypothetical protein